MTRTVSPTPTDPNTAALVRIVGLMAIVMLVALGWLMVSRAQARSEASVACAREFAQGLPPSKECR